MEPAAHHFLLHKGGLERGGLPSGKKEAVSKVRKKEKRLPCVKGAVAAATEGLSFLSF